jgi:hypothetical protein
MVGVTRRADCVGNSFASKHAPKHVSPSMARATGAVGFADKNSSSITRHSPPDPTPTLIIRRSSATHLLLFHLVTHSLTLPLSLASQGSSPDPPVLPPLHLTPVELALQMGTLLLDSLWDTKSPSPLSRYTSGAIRPLLVVAPLVRARLVDSALSTLHPLVLVYNSHLPHLTTHCWAGVHLTVQITLIHLS